MTVSTDRILPAPWGRSDVTEGSPPGWPPRRSPLALLQRPGLASSDTKIDLHVDPARFLGDVASRLVLHRRPRARAGRPVRRLPVPDGAVLRARPRARRGALAGAAAVARARAGARRAGACVRLVDLLAGRPRGIAHVVAGALTLLNPYVVVFAARTSVTLLGYAALPWLLRLRAARPARLAAARWRWPAAFALVVTASGGGVNAAVVAWILLGPLLLAGYEWWTGAAAAGPWPASPGGRRWPARRCRPGGWCRCSSSRATASTSCASPSSPGRSGAPPACPSRCG